MKKQKSFIGPLFIMLTMSSATMAQNSVLTFDEALQLMKSNNPALSQTQHLVREKEADKAIKRGLYMPHVSVEATAVSMSDPLHLDLTPVRDAILPLYSALGNYGVFSGVPNPDPTTNSIVPILPDNVSTQAVRSKLLQGEEEIANAEWDKTIQEKNFATASANLTWPLFTGGKISAANKAAKVEIENSKEELRNTEGELLSELVARYYGLALGLQAEKVRQQMLDAMTRHNYDAEKMFKEGMIAKVELLNSAVALSDANRELKQSVRNIEILQQGLTSTLAVEGNDSIAPSSHLFINKELPDANYFLRIALESNPKLNQIEGKSKLVDIKHNVGKGDYLPSAALFGTYTFADYNKSAYTPDWIVGVGVKWTIFDGLSRNNELRKTNEMKAQVNEAREKAHNDISVYINKLHQELLMQLEQVSYLDKTLELVNEYCTSTEKAFAQGLATSTSVVDAHTKVAQVKLLRLKVFYDYDTTLAKLLQTAGIPEQYLIYYAGENTIIESLN
jgi:outer membrane protein TolC